MGSVDRILQRASKGSSKNQDAQFFPGPISTRSTIIEEMCTHMRSKAHQLGHCLDVLCENVDSTQTGMLDEIPGFRSR